MNLRPTLRDVAERAGVGKTTVSLALRNDRRIPEKTRAKIQAAADELGYRPDPVLSRIAAHRWRGCASSGSTLAFVTTRHPNGRLLDTGALAGARRQAEAFGYKLEHFRLEDFGDPGHLAHVIFHRGIRGVIVGQITRSDFCEKFPWQDFSTVACNTGFYRPPAHLVMPDHSHAVMHAWQTVEARGYERIGVALFEEGSVVDEFDKTAAALYCQDRVQELARKVPVLHFQPEDRSALGRWMNQYRPDAVLGFNDSVYYYLTDVGHSIPRDVGFVSLMLDKEAIARKESIAGLEYDTEIVGRIAVEQVDILLRTNHTGIPERLSVLMVETKWRDGDSLPDRTKAGSRAAKAAAAG